MKKKEWKTLVTTDAEHCKHIRFICEGCGTLIYQQPVWSKTRAAQSKRIMKRLHKAIQESKLEEEHDRQEL